MSSLTPASSPARAIVLAIITTALAFVACSGDPEASSEGDRHPDVGPGGPASSSTNADAGATPPSSSTQPCGADAPWTCSGATRARCRSGVTETETCPSGCVASKTGDALCAVPAPSWSCGASTYAGAQYWTCSGGSIFRCQGGAPVSVVCPGGCELGPSGTDDACSVPLPPGSMPPLAVPAFAITIAGGLFAESAVRAPIEDGLRYELERIAKHVDTGTKTAAPFTIHFVPSNDSFASGIANVTYTNVYVPPGYPLTGNNQNFVVNITLHEIGHILANQLIAPRELRDTCVNEGLASWIAGKYWMNAASQPVASLRLAARAAIDAGRATASITNCVSASDAWYKVYASYFEYLELHVPGGILAVSSAKTNKSAYSAAWATWLMQ